MSDIPEPIIAISARDFLALGKQIKAMIEENKRLKKRVEELEAALAESQEEANAIHENRMRILEGEE